MFGFIYLFILFGGLFNYDFFFLRPSSSSSFAYDGGLPHFPLCSLYSLSIFDYRFVYARNIVQKFNLYIKICMIYKQCDYFILLLLYDFDFENVEINKTKQKQNKTKLTFSHGRLFCIFHERFSKSQRLVWRNNRAIPRGEHCHHLNNLDYNL